MDDSTPMIQLFHYGSRTWIAQIDAVAGDGCIAISMGFGVNYFTAGRVCCWSTTKSLIPT
jgi:hypothetical protein